MRLKHFLQTLRERHMYRVAVVYAAAAWLLIQLGDIVVDSFSWPLWLMQAMIAATIVAFPVVMLITWLYRGGTLEQAPEELAENVNSAPVRSRSLVVLPFATYSDHQADHWLADALVEDLVNLLGRMPGFHVVARNTASRYKGENVDVRQLAEDLGVSYVIEGSVRRKDAGVRIAAQLVSTDNAIQLWSEYYDRDVDDSSRAHDDLCREMTESLGTELTRAEMELAQGKPQSEWGAWELFQQAKGSLQFRGWNIKAFEETVDFLRRAIELDPEFAEAHAFLALVIALGHWSRVYPDYDAVLDEVNAEVEQAIELAPGSSEVLGYAGCALSDIGHGDRGIPIIERALDINPSNAQAHAALGASMVNAGNFAEGIEHLTYAIKLSPFNPGLALWCVVLSLAESGLGNWEKGLEWSHVSLKLDSRYFMAHLATAVAMLVSGDKQAAQAALSQAKQFNPDLSESAIQSMVGKQSWALMASEGLSLP